MAAPIAPATVIALFEEALSEEKFEGGLIFHRLARFLADEQISLVPMLDAVTTAVTAYLIAIRVLPGTDAPQIFSSLDSAATTTREMTALGRAMMTDLGNGNGNSAPLTPTAAPSTLAAIAAWRRRVDNDSLLVNTGGGDGITAEAYAHNDLLRALASLRVTGNADHLDRVLRELAESASPYLTAEPTHVASVELLPRPKYDHVQHLPGLAYAVATDKHAYADLGVARRRFNERLSFSREVGRFSRPAGRGVRLLAELFPAKLTTKEKEEDSNLVKDIESAIADPVHVAYLEFEAALTREHAAELRNTVDAHFRASSNGAVVSTIVPAIDYTVCLGSAAANGASWPAGHVPWRLVASFLLLALDGPRQRISRAVRQRRELAYRAAGLGVPPDLMRGVDYVLSPLSNGEEDNIRKQLKNRDVTKATADQDAKSTASSPTDNTVSEGDGPANNTRRGKHRKGKGRGRGGGGF